MKYPDGVVPALSLLDDPGAGLIVSGPCPESAGAVAGRFMVRAFSGSDVVSVALTKEQLAELWLFVRVGWAE